jgi:hypothetical protein
MRHLIPVFDAGPKSRSRKIATIAEFGPKAAVSTPREPVCGKIRIDFEEVMPF